MKPVEIQEQLELLQNRWCDAALLERLYGLRLPCELVMGAWRGWARGRPQRLEPERLVADNAESGNKRLFNRFSLETFFQDKGILPLKQAAASIGTTPESLIRILDALEGEGHLTVPARFAEQFVLEGFMRTLKDLFSDIRYTSFGNHDAYCAAIHREVKKSFEFEPSPLKCETAKLMKKDFFAAGYDVLTDEPLSIPYEVWLDLKKPLNLRPDTCSLHTYARFETIIQPYLFGAPDLTIPNELRAMAA